MQCFSISADSEKKENLQDADVEENFKIWIDRYLYPVYIPCKGKGVFEQQGSKTFFINQIIIL